MATISGHTRPPQKQRAAPGERLWINPDRGLETRGYAEVEPALRNLVAAANPMRADLR